jgi:type I restriction enzyme S subunit
MELMKGFKQTEVGKIPIDWEVKFIKEIAPLQRGFDLPNRELKLGNYPVVYSNGIVNYHDKFQAKSPGIVTGRSGTIGKVTFVEENYWPHNTALWVTNFFHNNPKFIFYLFLKIKLERFASGSGVPTLNRNDVHDFRIAIPTLPEQTAIANALSNIDELISQTEKLIDKKKAIKQGVMQELLKPKEGWVTKKLGEVCEIYTGKKNNQDKIEDGEYPFFVRSQTIERSNSYSYDGEAILVPGEGNIGKIFHYINGKFDFHQRVYKISDFSEMVYPKYVYLYIKENFGKYALSNSVKATVDSLRLPTFQEFILPFPNDINEQKEIAEVIFSLDKEIEMIELKHQKLKLQKQGMMQNLLTGKIRLL